MGEKKEIRREKGERKRKRERGRETERGEEEEEEEESLFRADTVNWEVDSERDRATQV